jgi:putative membrane protein
VWLTLFFAKQFSYWIQKVKYEWLCYSVIFMIVVFAAVLSSWIGLVILVVATCVGMIAPLVNVSRSQAMGCLLVPVVLWFLV